MMTEKRGAMRQQVGEWDDGRGQDERLMKKSQVAVVVVRQRRRKMAGTGLVERGQQASPPKTRVAEGEAGRWKADAGEFEVHGCARHVLRVGLLAHSPRAGWDGGEHSDDEVGQGPSGRSRMRP